MNVFYIELLFSQCNSELQPFSPSHTSQPCVCKWYCSNFWKKFIMWRNRGSRFGSQNLSITKICSTLHVSFQQQSVPPDKTIKIQSKGILSQARVSWQHILLPHNKYCTVKILQITMKRDRFLSLMCFWKLLHDILVVAQNTCCFFVGWELGRVRRTCSCANGQYRSVAETSYGRHRPSLQV